VKLGRYTILQPIARGGMAEIFLAEATDLPGVRRVVVVKRMLPEFARDEAYAKMFLDEARILASLSHPNVVQIVEAGRDGSDLFIAMERVEGESLASLVGACAARGGRMPLEHSFSILSAVLAGLHYLHERSDERGQPLNLIHRDVSARNVMVTYEGGVKLIDFGIARPSNRIGMTRSGGLKGTPAYMSPEQCRGLHLDRRTDIFSAGILLYELTVGQRLFFGTSEYDVIRKIVEEPITPPSAIAERYPPSLERTVMRALAKAPADRYATAEEFHDALDACARELALVASTRALAAFMRELFPERGAPAPIAPLAGTVGTATSEPLQAPPPESIARRRMVGFAVALIVAMVIGGVALFRLSIRIDENRAPTTEPISKPAIVGSPAVEPGPDAGLADQDSGAQGVDAGALARTAKPRVIRPAPVVADAGPSAPGTLVLDATPWCRVNIDGEDRGPTPLTVELPAGRHRIELRNEEFEILRTAEFSIEAGKRTARRFEFPRQPPVRDQPSAP
jgi:tRNA A-37 threonylcarbamoyl transferase component Bud32